MKTIINEDKRSEYAAKAKKADQYKDTSKGKNRFERRLKSRVSTSTAEFNQLDMSKLFDKDILDINVKVIGETNNYLVQVSFSGVIEEIKKELSKGLPLGFSLIMKSLSRAFDRSETYVRCTCEDWKYRFGYWSTVNDLSADPSKEAPDNGKGIANPYDSKGPACKHVLLVLNNRTWLMRVASVIKNYIEYIQKHKEKLYAEIIYPKLYDKEYEDDYQLSIDQELSNGKDDTSEIDVANKEAKTKNVFQKGNQSGIRWTKDESDKQINFDELNKE